MSDFDKVYDKVVYRKFMRDDNNSFVSVRESDGCSITFCVSDGWDSVSLNFFGFNYNEGATEAEYKKFLQMMECVKFAANAAMDSAADVAARMVEQRDAENDEVQE
jgi:hypothetical protein